MKTFYEMNNVGRAKYTVNAHDGIQTHKDGSPFFDIAIFKNKRDRDKYVNQLISDGYKRR